MLDLINPNLEWTYLDPGLANPDPQICYGRDELAAALHRQAENALTSHIEELRANGDQVLVVSHTAGVDAYRVTSANDRNYDVFTVQRGKVVAIHAYRDRADALAAIGIA